MEKAVIINASQKIKHERARWLKIKDKENGKWRYELVYCVVQDKKNTVIARRMNGEENEVSLSSGRKTCPQKAIYTAKDIEWFLQWGFHSFIKYQIYREDDVNGVIIDATKLPVKDLKKFKSHKNVISELTCRLQKKDITINKLETEMQSHIKATSNWQKKYNELFETKNEPSFFKRNKKKIKGVSVGGKEIQFYIQNASKFEQECKQLKKQNEELRKQIEDFAKFDAINSNMNHQDTALKIKLLTRQLNHVSNENKRLQEELNRKKGIISEDNQLAESLVNSNRLNDKIENNLQFSNDIITKQNAELNQQLNERDELIENKNKEIQDLNSQNDTLKDENNELKDEIKKFQEQSEENIDQYILVETIEEQSDEIFTQNNDTLKDENKEQSEENINEFVETVEKESDEIIMEEKEEKQSLEMVTIMDNEEEEKGEANIYKMSIEMLQKKYKILKSKNLTLQKQIMKLLSPTDDKSDFPVIEDIRGYFDTLRKQYFTDIFDAITSEISEQYEDENDDIIDREARRILFNLLYITYHNIRIFKRKTFSDIIEFIANKFELKSLKSKLKLKINISVIINPYFQEYYKIFSRHRFMKNNKNNELETSDMSKIITEIYSYIRNHIYYKYYKFWDNKSIAKQFEIFIAKACELCWIMVLNMPQLYFYPRLFSINDNNFSKIEYDKHVNFIYNEIENKKKSKKKKNKNDNEEKDEEEEMNKFVKKHNICNPFDIKIFDDKYHDCINEITNDDVDDNKVNNNNKIINNNGMEIAYCGWPSLVRVPQLEYEQHTQITKSFVYVHDQSNQFMSEILPKQN